MESSTLRHGLKSEFIMPICICIAVLSRVIFWLYTERIWEDALISLTAARNVWLGEGLTHHAAEPRVHSFTSALGQLILILGEYFNSGLLLMRLTSLITAAGTICFAYKSWRKLELPPVFFWFVGLYLSLDHLQIFFGMSGMETQIATMLLMAGLYCLLSEKWLPLGISLGLALICRPEFCIWIGAVGLVMLIRHPRHILIAMAGGALTSLPWIIFATLYYGSPVPHTVLVKSGISGHSRFWTQWGSEWWIDAVLNRFSATWKTMAPFKQYWFVGNAPIPDDILKLIVALVVALALAGSVFSCRINRKMAAPIIATVLFFTYIIIFRVNTYFMWYLPPFMALLMFLCGIGFASIASVWGGQRQVAVIALLLTLPYASHLPMTLYLDKMVQQEIENNVRSKVGIALNQLMKADDTVVLEPLGYIGWYAQNKTIFDWPGLGSPIAFAAAKKTRRMSGLIQELNPTFLVLRPRELTNCQNEIPEIMQKYDVVDRITARDGLRLSRYGLLYNILGDSDFSILARHPKNE